MELLVKRGDRMIMSAPIPGSTEFALHVFEVVEVVESHAGTRSAVAAVLKVNLVPVEDPAHVVITIQQRDDLKL